MSRVAQYARRGAFLGVTAVGASEHQKAVKNEKPFTPTLNGKAGCVMEFASPPPHKMLDTMTNTAAGAPMRKFEPIQVPAAVLDPNQVQASPYHDAIYFPDPDWRPLPTFTLDEVRKHVENNPKECWLTYRGGVYDMTTFLDCHPGGTGRIEMVAGSDLEEYWKVYTLHNRPHIQNLIEHYRIGNLSEEDAKRATAESSFGNYYDTDPKRDSAVAGGVRIPSVHPWNHEPPRAKLVESFFTPNELFFVRNHNNVPDIKEEDWTLDIEGNDKCNMKDCSFTLDDLKNKFPRHTVVASLQCAGNRQEDYVTEDKPLYVAPHWTGGAIGTAKWTGVKVRDVLAAAGMDVDGLALNKVEYPEAKIVNFIAEDMDETGTPYAGVIPIEKATDPWGDALLAYEMNGETLPRDHGYPIRLLAPGHAGCRNVKWIKNIMVSAKPSELDSGSKLDRHFDPAVEFMDHLRFGDDYVRLDLGPVIQTMPITSIICKPGKGEILQMTDDGTVQVKGIAFSGGGRGVCRVEVSADGGNTFDHCEMWGQKASVNPEMGQGRNWAWVQWEKKVKLPKDIAEKVKRGEIADVELVCKAIDGDFNTQPDKMESSYNSLGVCINHWDRVPIKVAKL